MPYIERDENNRISAIHKQANSEHLEEVDATTNEVLQFLLPESWWLDSKDILEKTDLSMVRVVEDLISVLIEKNLIQFTDLPQEAVNKILVRRNLRNKLDNIGGIFT